MKIDFRGISKELRHERNLKLKIRHELNENVADECSSWSDLEHKKEIIEAIHKNKKHSRNRERSRALKYEYSVDDYFPNEN